jgi:hypothetical protein
MKLLSFDPSGNWGKEGMGTTGFTLMEDGEIALLGEIKAKDYDSEVTYWQAHDDLITAEWPDHVIFEGYKLYNHKGKAASMQAHSELQTPQLIGVLKLACYSLKIPYSVQFASEVKTRWSESVLVNLGILEQRGKNYYWNGERTSQHKRDSMKHALHYWRYKRGSQREGN